MFENKLIEGIYVSRFVASWYNEGGGTYRGFKAWLGSLVINDRKLTQEEIDYIANFAFNGKLELEESVRRFLRDNS